MASEANSCYCRPTRQGVFRRTDLHILIEEPLNTISIDYCYAAVFEEQGLFLYFWSGVGYGPCGAGGGGKGRVFWLSLSERNGERLKPQHRYCVIERSEFGKPEVWRS